MIHTYKLGVRFPFLLYNVQLSAPIYITIVAYLSTSAMARCVKRRKLPYLGATLRSAAGNTGAVRRYITQRGGSVACHSTIWRSATIHYAARRK